MLLSRGFLGEDDIPVAGDGRRKVAMADETRVGPLWSKVVALVSVVLWSGLGSGDDGSGFPESVDEEFGD